MHTLNILNNIKETKQEVFDSYNNLMFSKDTRVFNKMTKRIELFLQTKEIVGDIWEIGVFKGAGLSLWAKLKNMYDYHSPTKLVGVDFFDPQECLEDLSGNNRSKMNDVLKRVKKENLSLKCVRDKLCKVNNKDILLLKGEAVVTCSEYIKNNPGVKIKILYMDLDLGKPTYGVLKTLWKNISLNGLVVFDEYALHCWDESVGVDKFLKEIKGQYEYFSTKINAPSMYIKKIV